MKDEMKKMILNSCNHPFYKHYYVEVAWGKNELDIPGLNSMSHLQNNQNMAAKKDTKQENY